MSDVATNTFRVELHLPAGGDGTLEVVRTLRQFADELEVDHRASRISGEDPTLPTFGYVHLDGKYAGTFTRSQDHE